jgi:outer membrane protein OmpA-like peptidoglycan-associated protein
MGHLLSVVHPQVSVPMPYPPACRLAWFPGLVAACLVVLMAVTAHAQDVPGAPETPLVTRYQGSRLVAWWDEGFTSVTWPTAYERDGDRWKSSITVEGTRQRRVYVAPAGRKALEVQRNYEAALTAFGATKTLSCEPKDPCRWNAGNIRSEYASWTADPQLTTRTEAAFRAVNASGELYHATFKAVRGGQTSYVTVLTVEGSSEGTATVLDIVTPKAMESGKVALATAEAIGQGLKVEGRMAVYGVSFDTGNADIKPESKAQLAEMAKLLKAQPTLKVFIVGHTDNQGQLDANIALSQHRAEAIVAALVRDHGIATTRLSARGVASFAPVATNVTDEGRARNRRVELVVQ